MAEFNITRDEAMELFKKYNQSESLLIHALSVESAMLHFAELFEEDVNKWGNLGLIHDLDYELYPDEHCLKVVELLEAENFPADYIKSIQSHAYGVCKGVDVEPTHKMEKVLYAADQLTGLIYACVLVRPSKSISDLTLKSVKKKWKDKAFAAAIDRAFIQKGIDMLGMDRDEFISETIEAMRKRADLLGIE